MMELNPGPQEDPAKYTADSWPTQVDSWGATAIKVDLEPYCKQSALPKRASYLFW